MSNKENQKILAAKNALDRDITLVVQRHNIQVEKRATIQIEGSPGIYNLTDLNDGNKLGDVTLRTADFYPGDKNLLYHEGELPTKLAEMLETSRYQLRRLVESDLILRRDIRTIDTDLGIYCYQPTVWPLEQRIPHGKKQILIATTEFFDTDFYTSSSEIGTVVVNVSEYVRGRTNYPEERIYQAGELKQALIQDSELLLAYLKRALHNAQHQYSADTSIDWKKTIRDFETYIAKRFHVVGK